MESAMALCPPHWSMMYNTYRRKGRGQRTEFKGIQEAAILRSSKEGWLNVSTPYDPKCVEDIKSYIESSGRRWNPDTKFWEVKEIHLGTLITILKKYFGENITQNLTAPESDTNAFKAVFNILKDMPNGNMNKVYAALANAIHPDHGGSDEQMKLLNEAYEEIKK